MTDPLTALEAAQLAACITAGHDAQAIHHAQQALVAAHRAGLGLDAAEHALAAARRHAHERTRQAVVAVAEARYDLGEVA